MKQGKANRVLPENALVIANTLLQQHKRRLYTWTSPDGQHQNQIDYILCRQRWRRSIQSTKTRPGADCGSDHELRIAKFRLKLKKVGKAARPLSYDLNQIPYDNTVEGLPRQPFGFFAFLFHGDGLDLRLLYNVMTSFHSSSGTLSIRSSPLNLFLTSTVLS